MCSHSPKVLITSRQLSRGVRPGGTPDLGVASLPGKCLTGCCFQNHWWYYILSGLKRRGSPVGASRQPGEVCWSLLGAACTHIHNIHTDGKYEPTQPPPLHTRTNADEPPNHIMYRQEIFSVAIYGRKMVDALITKHEPQCVLHQ